MDDGTLTGRVAVECGFFAGVRGDYGRLTRRTPSRARRAAQAATNRGFHALLLHRASRRLWRWRVPLLPSVCTRVMQHLFAVDIATTARLGPGVVIVHGFGVVIGSEVEIEGECSIFQGVTLGDRGSEWVGSDRTDGHPKVGRGVIFGAGAKVLGPVRVGSGSVIGANAVVLQDVPPGGVAAGVPARIVGRRDGPGIG